MTDSSEGSNASDQLVRLFQLQTRVVTTAFMGKALMLTIMIFNGLAEDLFSNLGLYAIHLSIIYFYAVLNFVGFTIISFASFLLEPKYLLYGFIIILVGFVIWIGVTVVGFVPEKDAFIYVCIDQRCPESHWLINMRFRNYGFKCPWDFLERTKPPPTGSGKAQEEAMKSYYFNCQNYSTPLVITSGVLAFAYFVFMCYTLIKTFTFYSDVNREVAAIKENQERI